MAQCEACPEGVQAVVIGLAAATFVAAIVLVHAARISYRRLPRAWQEQIRGFGFVVKIKLLIVFYQIATQIEKLYRVKMPAEVTAILKYVELAINIDFVRSKGPSSAKPLTPTKCKGGKNKGLRKPCAGICEHIGV